MGGNRPMIHKKALEDLAIFGGNPTFNQTLHVGRPNIGNRQKLFERMNDILDRRWLTNRGVYVQEFEQRVADFLAVKHCIAMCNGTVALEIAVRALDMRGEVIVPSFTFIATAHCLEWQEITPVFCDVDPETHNIDPEKVAGLITPRTTGIIGVHLWSRPCEIESLEKIAEDYNLKLLFDASHAFGCTYNGKPIGGFGGAEVFSFHATKFLNTFEGGAVVTNDDNLAEKIRLMKNFGFSGMDSVIYIGTNGKMNEVSAAMGITSLESLDDFININHQNYQTYRTHLADIPGIKLLRYDDREKNNFQYVIGEIDESKTGINRNHLMKILHAENIRARRYFYPSCHRMEPYKSYYPNAGILLPETERLSERLLCLPAGTAIEPAAIRQICHVIQFVVKNGAEITTKITDKGDGDLAKERVIL